MNPESNDVSEAQKAYDDQARDLDLFRKKMQERIEEYSLKAEALQNEAATYEQMADMLRCCMYPQDYPFPSPPAREQGAMFAGWSPRDCGDHRTVGDHRAWCFDCGEWCYSYTLEAGCEGCRAPNTTEEM
jgi:hypothetical protein